MLHPAVGYAFERFVLGAAGRGTLVDVFAVLGTAEEDQRARNNGLVLDEQDYLRSAEGAALLEAALTRLSPVAVRIDTSPGNATCGIPATGQFEKIAACVDLARAQERLLHNVQANGGGSASGAFRYDMMLRTRPDVLWRAPVLSGGVSLGGLATYLRRAPFDLQRTVMTADDKNMLIPRASWSAISAMRPGSLDCARLCRERLWSWLVGVRTHCLMKAHFASKEVHHVELMGAALREDVLHASTLPPYAPPLTPTFDGIAWGSEWRKAPSPPLPADRFGFGLFDILRPTLPRGQKSKPYYAEALGLAVTCVHDEEQQHPRGGGCSASRAPLRCSLCTTPQWLGRAPLLMYHGFCEVTEGEGDCAKGNKGAWEMGQAGMVSEALVAGASACVRRCEACHRCRFVSFSQSQEDCSWFHDCKRLPDLKVPDFLDTFRTVQVRDLVSGELIPRASAPPHGAAACPARPTTLWQPRTGFATDAQGSTSIINSSSLAQQCKRASRKQRAATHHRAQLLRGNATEELLHRLVRLFPPDAWLSELVSFACADVHNRSLGIAADRQTVKARPVKTRARHDEGGSTTATTTTSTTVAARGAHALIQMVPQLRPWTIACERGHRRKSAQVLIAQLQLLQVGPSAVEQLLRHEARQAV